MPDAIPPKVYGALCGAELLPDRATLCSSAAWLFVDIARESIASRGRFVVALTGGRTATIVHKQLTHSHRHEIDWGKTHLFWGDERCVPPGHPQSNYAEAFADLISEVKVPQDNVHRIEGEVRPPEEAARQYECVLGQFGLNRASAAGNRFDLVFLSVGADGHIASLFPGSPALGEASLDAVAVEAPPNAKPRERVTLTLPVINRARSVLVMASGAEKAPIVRKLAAGGQDSAHLPAALVKPSGELLWFLDKAAAAG